MIYYLDYSTISVTYEIFISLIYYSYINHSSSNYYTIN